MATPSAPTERAVLDVLRTIRDPDQGQDIVSLGLVKDLRIQDAEVSFTLAFAGQAPATKAALHSGASKAVSALHELEDQYGERFRPAPALVEMAREGGRYYPT